MDKELDPDGQKLANRARQPRITKGYSYYEQFAHENYIPGA